MSSHVWTGRLHVAGKPCDVKLAVDFNLEKAGLALAKKATKSKRHTATICYGAIHAEVLEVQQVIE